MGNQVSSKDFLIAEARWFQFWGKPYLHDKSFARFLGMHSGIKLKHSTDCTLLLRPSAVKKIKLLAGPYHHALLTVYKLKKARFLRRTLKS